MMQAEPAVTAMPRQSFPGPGIDQEEIRLLRRITHEYRAGCSRRH